MSGGYGNAANHVRTWKLLPSTSRKRCSCGCKKRATRYGLANGVGMMSGCELLVQRWIRDPRNAWPQDPAHPWLTD